MVFSSIICFVNTIFEFLLLKVYKLKLPKKMYYDCCKEGVGRKDGLGKIK